MVNEMINGTFRQTNLTNESDEVCGTRLRHQGAHGGERLIRARMAPVQSANLLRGAD